MFLLLLLGSLLLNFALAMVFVVAARATSIVATTAHAAAALIRYFRTTTGRRLELLVAPLHVSEF